LGEEEKTAGEYNKIIFLQNGNSKSPAVTAGFANSHKSMILF
jgi:hypothetical protein